MTTRTARDDGEYHPALPYLLAIAVYQDLDEVRRLPDEVLQREAIAAADVIASGGDRLLRWERPGARGGRAGREEFQAVWRATVRGLAIAAMQPGGIVWMGIPLDAAMLPPDGQGGPTGPAGPEMVDDATRWMLDVWDMSLRAESAERLGHDGDR